MLPDAGGAPPDAPALFVVDNGDNATLRAFEARNFTWEISAADAPLHECTRCRSTRTSTNTCTTLKVRRLEGA